MKLFQQPVTLPGPLRFGTEAEREVSRCILWFMSRSFDLLHAAGFVDGAGEPGLLLPEDQDEAQRRGAQAAESLPKANCAGRAEIGYLRSLTTNGMAAKTCPYETIMVLKDACGLGSSFLGALAWKSLERGHLVQLCPSPLNSQRLEAVLLPELGAAWVSDRTGIYGRTYALDEIPDAERTTALREAMLRDSALQQDLIRLAEEQMQMAGILYQVIL